MEDNVKAMLQEVTDREKIPESAAYNIRCCSGVSEVDL